MRVSDEEIIAALLAAKTHAQAAKVTGLSERQLYTRMGKDGFKGKMAEAKRRILEAAAIAAQRRMSEAVDVMAEIMSNADNSPQVRLNAADALRRNAARLTEQSDILERVAALEAAFGER